ncbi:unnamed protein product [Miscanthus lutarioriparius]|uniref:Uncharacterized protein n=1 Tax=Miscanthus lutarioriparius TaxID=422564 RepID=A0A811SNK9_9POAL|nr:unnamed protein product [Miscanthus lutarioriparius]
MRLVSSTAPCSVSSYGPYWRNSPPRRHHPAPLAHRVACMTPAISAEVRAMVRSMDHATAGRPRRRRAHPAEAEAVRALPQRPHGDHRADQDARTEANADTDMSPEAQEFKQIIDELVPYMGTANRWDYLPVLRWFDVFGVRNKILDAV